MAADASAPPVWRASFSTAGEEETENFLRQTYVENRTTFHRVDEDAEFAVDTAEGPGMAADRSRSRLGFSMDTEPFDYFHFFIVENGRHEVRGDGEPFTLVPGDCAVHKLGIDLRLDAFDVGVRALRVPRERLLRTATELGDAGGVDFRLDGTGPVSAPMARRWAAVLSFANETMLGGEAELLQPLLLEEMTRTVAVTALHTFPNPLMRNGKVRSRRAARPDAIRRATAFIEANADTPITITEIAAAAGVTPRALQYGFRRHLDTTPLAYLRRVRLQAAHYDLRDADPGEGVTVAEVSRRWGFAKPGRFSVYYRQAYGLSPSQTLRR